MLEGGCSVQRCFGHVFPPRNSARCNAGCPDMHLRVEAESTDPHLSKHWCTHRDYPSQYYALRWHMRSCVRYRGRAALWRTFAFLSTAQQQQALHCILLRISHIVSIHTLANMFPFPNFMGASFQSQLESGLSRSGPRSLAYAESNKYAIKQQILTTHQVRSSFACVVTVLSALQGARGDRF